MVLARVEHNELKGMYFELKMDRRLLSGLEWP